MEISHAHATTPIVLFSKQIKRLMKRFKNVTKILQIVEDKRGGI